MKTNKQIEKEVDAIWKDTQSNIHKEVVDIATFFIGEDKNIVMPIEMLEQKSTIIYAHFLSAMIQLTCLAKTKK